MSQHKCSHTDRPIFSHGLCKSCATQLYHQKQRDKALGLNQKINFGDEVIVIQWNKRGIVTGTKADAIFLNNEPEVYLKEELRLVTDQPKPTINKFSDQRTLLTKIYGIIRKEYLANNSTCQIQLEGCTHKAIEIHHRYVRTGYFLVMSKYFYSTCHNCHEQVTINSELAIAKGISFSRHSKQPEIFSQSELDLLEQYKVKLPKSYQIENTII